MSEWVTTSRVSSVRGATWIARLAVCLILLAVITCAPPASTSNNPSPSASLAGSPSPAGTPIAGACTSTSRSSQQVVEQLFVLSTSADWRKVADCYARAYQQNRPGFADYAAGWAVAGPATLQSVHLVDRVNECDRFEVVAELANGDAVAWQGRQRSFYSVGLDSGVPRVFDAGSALAAPELTRVTCR